MRTWAIPAAIIVAIEYLFAFAVGARVGFHYRIPFETYAILGMAFAGIGAALILLWKLLTYVVQRERSPSKRLIGELPYVAGFVSAVLLSALQISVLTWTKVMLPIASPFWADPLLANVDRAIFRADPWVLAGWSFGWAAPVIDRAYVTWAPVKFATFLLLALAPQSRTKSRALVAYFFMMATVAIGQYVLSSAGPVFYEQLGFGTRFSQMPIEPWVATTQAYLWRGYLQAGGEIGGGISAMPSLHVAAALWVALVCRSYDRRLGWLAFLYFAMILIGSVLLGWHYAADAFVAVLIAVGAWALARTITCADLPFLAQRLKTRTV
jgi:hypothetical protein